MPRQYTHIPVETRLWERVTKSDGCWLYGGGKMSGGYGAISDGKRTLRTHILAWELAAGPMPDGLLILHTCDNRACCRNDDEGWYEVNGILHPRRGHLWLGSHGDNMADMTIKGRAALGIRNGKYTHPERTPRGEDHGLHIHPESVLRGESNGNAKVTEKEVREIRSRYAEGGISHARLSVLYNISEPAVAQIINRRTWRHIE